MNKLNIAVIGCGYWGPNLIRNFNQIPNCRVTRCCDVDARKLERISSLYPGVATTRRLEDILEDPAIAAVAIATPAHTHMPIGKSCLQHGKHVLIEKPLASSAEECIELIRLSERSGRVLMVGHTFQYAAAVNKAKEVVESGELGEIYYISCTRANLGLFQPDINVVWDLAPHDISIIFYVLSEFPLTVNAQGKAHFKPHIEDVANLVLNFPNGTIAFIHNSWLHPDKIRKITIVGSKKMLVYDDISPNEKIKIYDKGIDVPPYYNSFAEFQLAYRYGDIHTPRINEYEPLKRECEHFVECIKYDKTPLSDGYSGLRVVSVLEAANKSLSAGGTPQAIDNECYFSFREVA